MMGGTGVPKFLSYVRWVLGTKHLSHTNLCLVDSLWNFFYYEFKSDSVSTGSRSLEMEVNAKSRNLERQPQEG